MKLTHLTDTTLLADAKALAQNERTLTIKILWHLREIDRRKLYADLKYSSLWEYAIKELGYSEGTAYRRISAARALGAMPELEEKLNHGSFNLTAVAAVLKEFKHASTEEKREVFAAIENKTPAQTKKIIQEKSKSPKRMATIEVDEETLELIQELKSLRSHQADVVKEALKEAIERAKQQKFKSLKKPNLQLEVRPSQRSIQRDVFAKAAHRCQNCGSKHILEIDHIRPKALGGPDARANLRVLCRSCNQRAGMRAGLSMVRKVLRSPTGTQSA